MLGQAHVGWTGGREARRLLQSRLAPAQPASSRPTPPSHPLSHQLCQTSRGNWERTVWGRGGETEDTPSFLLVTGSNFQYTFQALVMTEVIMPFLAPRITEAEGQVGTEALTSGCLPAAPSPGCWGLGNEQTSRPGPAMPSRHWDL